MKTARIRIIKHEAVPGCGSFEVRYADGRASQYFYWDDIPARRVRPQMLDVRREKAKALARGCRDSLMRVCVRARRCTGQPVKRASDSRWSGNSPMHGVDPIHMIEAAPADGPQAFSTL
jgi:hypothetical protein